MPNSQRFNILTPDGLISQETFVMADQQPLTMPAGCVLVVHEGDGKSLTVHQSRLIPAQGGMAAKKKSVCLNCGRVQGVVADQVHCPHDHANPCRFLQIEPERPAAR